MDQGRLFLFSLFTTPPKNNSPRSSRRCRSRRKTRNRHPGPVSLCFSFFAPRNNIRLQKYSHRHASPHTQVYPVWRTANAKSASDDTPFNPRISICFTTFGFRRLVAQRFQQGTNSGKAFSRLADKYGNCAARARRRGHTPRLSTQVFI